MIRKNNRPFKLHSGDEPAYFFVYVFDTKLEMWQWWSRYRKRITNPHMRDDERHFSAKVIPYEKIRFDGGQEVRDNNIGVCIFYRDKMGAGLVSHEMLHCALWHERLLNGNSGAVFGEQVGEEEERLAYLLTGYVISFVNKCTKLGFYQ